MCRRFFRYRLWYFCRSPIEPCSACILPPVDDETLVLLLLDSKSLAAAADAAAASAAAVLLPAAAIDFAFDLILMRLILIFGDGVNERTTSA